MITHTNLLLAGAVLTVVGAAVAGDVDRLPGDGADYYKAIKPIAAERKWKRVPWLTDLDVAVKTAAREKRPVCVWVVDNEPLERC